MRGRRSGVWLILCGLLAWYIRGSRTVEYAEVEVSEVIVPDTKPYIDLEKLLKSIYIGIQDRPTNKRSHEVLVFLMYIYTDIDETKQADWQDIYDQVYIPSFAENMIEIHESERNELYGYISGLI